MPSRKSVLLWLGWVAAFGLAVTSSVPVVRAVLRDLRVTDPVLTLDVTQPVGWRETPFRVWGEGRHLLYISAVNWDSIHAGAALGAQLDVAVLTPNGQRAFTRRYPAGSTGLYLPLGYASARLAELDLDDDWPMRMWTMRARVRMPDDRFKTAGTTLKLYKERYETGLGALTDYVMIVPAAFFMLLALGAALWLMSAGRRAPILLTSITVVALVTFITA